MRDVVPSTNGSSSRPADTYPPRPSHFAHRYTRLLTKTCAAQEIGHVAFVLCVTIVHQEDAKRYKGPVTYFNEQLMPLVGVAKWEALDKARKRAVAAGWLHFAPGNRGLREPGRYWVTIPSGLDDLADAPCDESHYPANGEWPQKHYPANGYREGERDGDRQGYREGEHSTLFPKSPIPTPVGRKRPGEETGFEDFQEAWNATPGVRRCIAPNTDRTKAFKTRIGESIFRDNWRAILARFPLPLHASQPDGWKPDADWFLRPNTVTAILEGKYDWTKSNGQHKAQPPAKAAPPKPQFADEMLAERNGKR